MNRTELISAIKDKESFDFNALALQLFKYQYKYNETYRLWVNNLKCNVDDITSVTKIPFLPISSFKTYKLHCQMSNEETVFLSSGTSGQTPSRHYVFDKEFYLENTASIFESFYGAVEQYCFLALLPSYLERTGSSLIAMVDYFISRSKYDESGFYLYDHESLYLQLKVCKEKKMPTVLFGVSFALLDFISEYSLSFPELTIIETGGMKGRKKEITRNDLHDQISNGFDVSKVHSEYGMTELFSQAYSKKDGLFYPGKTMQVFIKDITDPLESTPPGKSGIINIIDLANIDSCAFIETQDLGRKYEDGSFEVLGRLDMSDIRGCNLMVGDV